MLDGRFEPFVLDDPDYLYRIEEDDGFFYFLTDDDGVPIPFFRSRSFSKVEKAAERVKNREVDPRELA